MKKLVFFFLMLFLFASITNAAIECSTQGKSGKSTIDKGEIKQLNGLNIGVIDTSGSSLSVDLMLDAKLVLLEDGDEKTFDFKLGEYDITMINLTDDLATIKIEGDTEEVELEEIKKVDDLQVYVKSMGGIFPGTDAELEMIVGQIHLFLYNNDVYSIETIGGVKYGIEFIASSSQSASLEVTTCENGTLTYVSEEIETGDEPDTQTNTTNTTTQNNTNSQITIESVDDSVNADESSIEVTEDSSSSENAQERNAYAKYSIVLGMILITVIVILFFKFKSNNSKIQGDV